MTQSNCIFSLTTYTHRKQVPSSHLRTQSMRGLTAGRLGGDVDLGAGSSPDLMVARGRGSVDGRRRHTIPLARVGTMHTRVNVLQTGSACQSTVGDLDALDLILI